MSGPKAYRQHSADLGPSLADGREPDKLKLPLIKAIRMAMKNNLDVRLARLTPAIARTQVIQAQAAFDAVLFGSAQWEKDDTPQASGQVPGLTGNQQSQVFKATTGIRKPLITGGTLTLQTDFSRQEQEPSYFTAPSFYNADVRLQFDQPLLRGFGADVNRAKIVLARSARASQVQQLKTQLLKTAQEVEAAYWDLAFSRANLLIQQGLLQRTTEDRDRLVDRQDFDATPVRVTEANSFVELRKADVVRAQLQVQTASDELKRLINSPNIPVSGETIIMPTDSLSDQPIRFSLLDSVTTALRERPELQRALLAIKDASVRQRVADNARLPLLNLTAAVAYNGLDIDNGAGAYRNMVEGDFINYILGGKFEYPLGNREAQGLYRQRQLEQHQAVLQYQEIARDVVVQLKNAMHQVVGQFRLVGITQSARRAAADSLRAIEEKEKAGVIMTPEFLLDLKLDTQKRLADAEVQEARALSGYSTAIAKYYQAMGTLLKRNQIVFEDPATDRVTP